MENIRIDMIINNLKMTSTASVDRMVLFLQLLLVLVKDSADWGERGIIIRRGGERFLRGSRSGRVDSSQ